MINNSLLSGEKGNGSSSNGGGEALPDYEKPNREDAKEFFLSTLPRRIVDPTQRTGHRLAKPGERKDHLGNESYLYPLTTSDDALSEFGIGIGLYFQTVKALCVVLLLCACFSLIALTHNSKFNPDNTLFNLEGSVYGATRGDLQFSHQGVSDIMVCVIICAFTILSNYMEKKTVTKIDVSQQTTQDYSVECTNPPLNCLDMDVYYKFFSQFGEVVLLSIALNNGELLKALADRKAVECVLQGLVQSADEDLKLAGTDTTSADQTVNDDSDVANRSSSINLSKYEGIKPSFLQRIGFTPTIKSCFKELQRISIDIDHLCTQEYEPWRVFVTFNSEHSQRNCLRNTNVGKFSVFMNKVDNEKCLLYGKTLNIIEASEPNDVIYETSHRSLWYRCLSWLISYFICFVFLLGSFFVIETLSGNGNVLVAIFISIVNATLPAIIKAMTQLVEVHITERDVQKSMLLKLVIGRCINSAILIYVATNYNDTFGEGSLVQMQNILIADAITTPLLRLMNIYDFVMRYLVVPHYAKTQEQYNAAWQGAEWNLAERYTDMLKTVFVGLFFLVPLPSGLFISAFAMVTTYLVDKYSLLRLWQRNPSIDHSLGTISRYFLVVIVFTHLSISRIYFANWPYNDSGNKANCNFFVCDTDDEDMTKNQKDIVDVYSGFCVAMFIIAVLWGILYKVYMGIQKFYYGNIESVGDASAIHFTTVPNLEGYCPNVTRSGIFSPLLCVDTSHLPTSYIPLRKAEAGYSIDPKDFSLYNAHEFPADKVDGPEKLAAIFGKMKCYNSALYASQGQKGGSEGVLPAGWEKKQAPDGRQYYVDHHTQTTHWTLPNGLQQQHHQQHQQPITNRQQVAPSLSPSLTTHVLPSQSLGLHPLPANWEQRKTPGGRIYYVDHASKLTQWERPQCAGSYI